MSDREHMVQMLARQVLAMREPDGSVPGSGPGIEDAGHASVTVEIQGVVRTIRRQIWIDSAAINASVVAEIEKQASEIDLKAEIAKMVRAEITQTMRDIGNRIRTTVHTLVDQQVTLHVGSLSKRIARKFADKMWTEALK